MLHATPAFDVSVPLSEISPDAPALIATRGLLAARPPPPGAPGGGGVAPPGAPFPLGPPKPPPPAVQTYSRSASPTGEGLTAPPRLPYSQSGLPVAGS